MRPRLLVVVFLLCGSSALPAQTPDQPAADAPQSTTQPKSPKPPPATATITGTVFCGDTHRPARGAMVMAQFLPKDGHIDTNFNARTSRVRMDGTYTIDHLRAGDYAIIALLPGYLSPFDGLQINETTGSPSEDTLRERLAHNSVVSVRDDETAHMDVTLERGATVSGRVLYDDGAPATQVLVSVEDVNAKPPAHPNPGASKSDPDSASLDAGSLVRGLFLHQTQDTDDQGNFRIPGLRPGTYRIVATPSTFGENADDPNDIFGLMLGAVPTLRAIHFYGGDTFHKKAAKTYDLRAGEETSGIEITIPVYAFHRVEGHLTTLDGRPILSAAITLTDTSDDSFSLRTRPGRDGAFSFPEVPAGTYKLAIAGAQLGSVREQVPVDIVIEPAMLQNVETFADSTKTVLVKDDDITDLSIQLSNAQPASVPSQDAQTPSTPVQH